MATGAVQCAKASGDFDADLQHAESTFGFVIGKGQVHYRHALGQAGLVASMSRKGNCYDNATMESFWSTLKLELIYRTSFATRTQARSQIFDYIETFYNRQRSHSALDYRSPVDFEFQNN